MNQETSSTSTTEKLTDLKAKFKKAKSHEIESKKITKMKKILKKLCKLSKKFSEKTSTENSKTDQTKPVGKKR